MSSFNNHSIFLVSINRFCYEVGRVISKKYLLTVNERNTLILLSDLKINSIKSISTYFSISKINTAKILNTLKRKSVQLRMLDKADRRHNQIFLTEEGKLVTEKVITEIANLFERRIAQFSERLGEKIQKLVDEYNKQIQLNQTSNIN